MRRILVLLILFLCIVEARAQDLYLVKILSVDKQTKQVVADIVDGPDRIPLSRVNIHSESLVMGARPGDLVRLWGEVAGNGNNLIVDSVVPGSGVGSDPTGVRRRLRNNIQTHGRGGRGKGHGGF